MYRDRHGTLLLRRPFNEWTLTHMGRLLPTATVRRAPDARPLPGRSRPLDVAYTVDGRRYRLADLHRRTYTTAFVVVRHGELVHESYPGRFAGPDATFGVFSLGKAVLSLLAGIAAGDGLIRLGDPVTAYRPDFAGTAYDGPLVADLLDMTSGAGGREVWADRDSDIRRFVHAALRGGDLAAVLRGARRTAAPGTRFNYSTLDAQMLAWVVEAAAGRSLAGYAADRLWGPMGAERDASYGLTRTRPPAVLGAGSFHASARDLARIGVLLAQDGTIGGRRVVPAGWAGRTAAPQLAVGALGDSGYDHYGYATLWWTVGGDRPARTGLGVHGQYLYVDPTAGVVVVKCSAWPAMDDERLDRETLAALRAVAAHLS